MPADQTDLYNQACFDRNKLVTEKYTTAFSIGIKAFDKKLHVPGYATYGFLRCADEIVHNFHQHDKHS